MSGKKKGMLTIVWNEYQRHLRPSGRRKFWSHERTAVRQSIQFEIQSEMFDSDNDTSYRHISKKMDNNLL
jgi:hypothetical protein